MVRLCFATHILYNRLGVHALLGHCLSPSRHVRLSVRTFSARSDDSGQSSGNSPLQDTTNLRRKLLHESLVEIGLDPGDLETAVDESIVTGSYDGRYGQSSIRTCRSFYYPKKQNNTSDLVQLKAAALRTARQVDFLFKRHQAHQAEWIRHHDTTTTSSDDDDDARRRFPLIVLLDNVRSANNVGSILRTADAAGCAALWTVGITPHRMSDTKLQKSALGAERAVPIHHFDNWQLALDYWKEAVPGYRMIAMETTEKSIRYTDYSFDQAKGVILILGNEVTGVDSRLMEATDAVVQIPTFGVKNSLNVAACAPIVLYEILRQWDKAEILRQWDKAEND